MPAAGSPATPTGDNSRVSVDWPGTYRGGLPCADCEAVRTEITLNEDGSYVRTVRYVGKEEARAQSEGTFSWDGQGSRIALEGPGEAVRYLVGENVLIQLDPEGNRIAGSEADRYRLPKAGADLDPVGKYWRLVAFAEGPVLPEARRVPHLKLMENGRVVGSGGCNNLMGTYNLADNGQISFSNMAATKMACPDMRTEGQLLRVLNAATDYTVRGDTLALAAAGRPLATFAFDYFGD